ncbi:hypothetical protein ELH02_04110 [Rhizobium ruizarguesonis]|nr:hypothetical protein ELH67_04160 [Rhizobium ruizarguesonis]TBA36702.1 hypothetical protein ELH60_04215 [Rhizobium ruizarguesonis]TBC62037.1 hypothetical protein ELH36_04205 [Rhizobium ruizarguesonis]TBD36703.1 hypothetical protein ELH18_04105 [Rhizobium ruizarguesonis]TBD41472.1 hypothetical protein ELH19_04135 [Rhizobium ruizarguesonis]
MRAFTNSIARASSGERYIPILCPDAGRCRLEPFRFSPNHENALSLCFTQFPDAKPLRTFAGIALAVRPTRPGCLDLDGQELASSAHLVHLVHPEPSGGSYV